MDFGPGELLDVFQDGAGRVNAAGVGQPIDIAFCLLLDFGGLDQPDDGVGGEVAQEAGGLVDGPGGAVAEGDEAGFVDVAGGAEGFDVELVDGLDLVAEEVDADGRDFAGGPDVDDFAADGEVAGVFDGVKAGVAVVGEPADELVAVEGLADADGRGPGPARVLARARAA